MGLAESWSAGARGYDRYWAPRFAPWTQLTVATLAKHADALPDGPVLVPACGPGRELPLLGAALPNRHVIGVDLSPGMIALARVRCAGSPWLHAEVGDAVRLAEAYGPVAAIATVFGLQQLPDPAAALADWCAALAPGAPAVCCWWPARRADSGPDTLARAVMARHTSAPPRGDWEAALPGVVAAAGATVLEDCTPAFPIAHADAAEFWDALVDAGSARALADRVGPDAVATMRAEFLREHPPGPITDRPAARLLVVQRPA